MIKQNRKRYTPRCPRFLHRLLLDLGRRLLRWRVNGTTRLSSFPSLDVSTLSVQILSAFGMVSSSLAGRGVEVSLVTSGNTRHGIHRAQKNSGYQRQVLYRKRTASKSARRFQPEDEGLGLQLRTIPEGSDVRWRLRWTQENGALLHWRVFSRNRVRA